MGAYWRRLLVPCLAREAREIGAINFFLSCMNRFDFVSVAQAPGFTACKHPCPGNFDRSSPSSTSREGSDDRGPLSTRKSTRKSKFQAHFQVKHPVSARLGARIGNGQERSFPITDTSWR